MLETNVGPGEQLGKGCSLVPGNILGLAALEAKFAKDGVEVDPEVIAAFRGENAILQEALKFANYCGVQAFYTTKEGVEILKLDMNFLLSGDRPSMLLTRASGKSDCTVQELYTARLTVDNLEVRTRKSFTGWYMAYKKLKLAPLKPSLKATLALM